MRDDTQLLPDHGAEPPRYVSVQAAGKILGQPAGMLRTKIARKVWLEGREYIRTPDRRILVDWRACKAWGKAGGDG